MGVQTTVVFTDLHGSTAVFEALGNARAAESVTQITTWIARQCEQFGGTVVKTLGDGVLAMFVDKRNAVNAVVNLQRSHSKWLLRAPSDLRMPMRIGVASGEVEMLGNDCYGDPVNVASRLCDLCEPNQIWANAATVDAQSEAKDVSFRLLGPINIRGRAEPCTVFQIEWREEVASDFLTMQADLVQGLLPDGTDALGREIELSWLGENKKFHAFDMPITIGRGRDNQFVVDDRRVSRTHARLEWRNGSLVFVDVSSYGSWVRFNRSAGADVLLRREECVLHGQGEFALGASFADPSVPTVSFAIR